MHQLGPSKMNGKKVPFRVGISRGSETADESRFYQRFAKLTVFYITGLFFLSLIVCVLSLSKGTSLSRAVPKL